MKKNYLIPTISVVKVDGMNMIAQSVQSIGGNTNIKFGGKATEGNYNARIKEDVYDVWNDNWSE